MFDPRRAAPAGGVAVPSAFPLGAIACAVSTVAIVGVGLSLTMTLIAVRLGEQGYSSGAIGFNTAAAGLSTVASASFVPGLARRIGVGRLLFAAVLLCELCLAAMAAKDDFWLWLGLRALFGVGLTILFVLSEYWINAVAPQARRGAILGFYAAAVSLGFAAGPLILALVGVAGPTPFFAAMALFAAAALPIVLGSRSAPPIETHASAPVLGFLLVAPIATLAGLLHGAIETACMGLLPVFALRSSLGVETGAWFVTLFALGSVAFQFPVGYIADYFERGRLLAAIALASLCGALALAVLPPGRALSFGALLLIWGGVAGSFYAVALGYLGDRFRGSDLASANAAFVMLYAGGMLAGPLVAGVGMDALGPRGLFISIDALLALYLIVVRFSPPGEAAPLRS